MRRVIVTACLVLAFAARSASAGCTIDTTGLAFGTYDAVAGGPALSTATLVVTCDLASPVTLQVSSSRGRLLRAGGEQLAYELFLDDAATVPWGDGGAGTHVWTGTAPAGHSELVVPVFGRIAGGQSAAVGVYGDAVAVTLSY